MWCPCSAKNWSLFGMSVSTRDWKRHTSEGRDILYTAQHKTVLPTIILPFFEADVNLLICHAVKKCKTISAEYSYTFFIEIFNLPVFFPFKDTPFSFYQTLTNWHWFMIFTATWSKCISNHHRWWHFALYVSGFCHIHAKTPGGMVVCEQWLV